MLKATLCGLMLLSAPVAGWAQNASSASHGNGINPRIERLRHEDAGSKVDELRVGGLTRRIDVETKAGTKSSYQIEPKNTPTGTVSPASERTGGSGSAGRSSWRLLQF